MANALRLYLHPLSSYCHKVLIALYENDTPFTPQIVNLGDATDRADFLKVWPIGQFPVLRDEARDWLVPESSIIIEYLDRHYPGGVRFLPPDPDKARQVRMYDRFFDQRVHAHMQKITGDKLRPAGSKDPFGVQQANDALHTAYDMIDASMAEKTWAMGEDFSMADCAAAPALLYANVIVPFGARKNIAAYLGRLMKRPSFARALREAGPYIAMYPFAEAYRATYPDLPTA